MTRIIFMIITIIIIIVIIIVFIYASTVPETKGLSLPETIEDVNAIFW